MQELVADGRATLATLAEKAGLSISAVQSRVRRLEARKVIRGYTAKVDPDALGHGLSAFVAITPLDPSQPDDAPARLRNLPAIEACHSVAGEESYVLLVRVASPRELEHLLQEIRATANVHTRSTIILQTFYDR
ncbi:AsnC family transcriptional regulator [Rhodococcus sp. SC4]|jgi:Lrp/AsnC family leucine-responsive transcriptional regulator|nr:AsnC family transcriptional regulator [Rhodococcus sp. SC4]